MKKSIKWIILVAVVVLIGVLVVNGVKTSQKKSLEEQRLDELVEQARERADNLEKAREGVEVSKENESNLTEEDVDLTKMMTKDDVRNHAMAILSIMDDESRLQAIEKLPLTDSAKKKYFGNADNIFYGDYDDLNIDILFSGLDYEDNTQDYHANVICNIRYMKDGEEVDSEVVSLVINYKDSLINSWNY